MKSLADIRTRKPQVIHIGPREKDLLWSIMRKIIVILQRATSVLGLKPFLDLNLFRGVQAYDSLES